MSRLSLATQASARRVAQMQGEGGLIISIMAPPLRVFFFRFRFLRFHNICVHCADEKSH